MTQQLRKQHIALASPSVNICPHYPSRVTGRVTIQNAIKEGGRQKTVSIDVDPKIQRRFLTDPEFHARVCVAASKLVDHIPSLTMHEATPIACSQLGEADRVIELMKEGTSREVASGT